MKPNLFDSPEQAIQFINSLPSPSGNTKQGSADEIKSKCVALVVPMFELRKVLVKSEGGVGNYKSLTRFADAASDNVSKEVGEQLIADMNAIEAEIKNLLDIGASDEMAEQIRSVKSNVARFQLMNASINGFKVKLKSVLERVEERNASLLTNLETNSKALKKILGNDAVTIHEDYTKKAKEIKDLSKKLDQYCDLQIAYNGLFLK